MLLKITMPLWFFFCNDTAPTEIYTLSLHDALPISPSSGTRQATWCTVPAPPAPCTKPRSEEHTSELQSQFHLVCRLLLEKKKKKKEKKKTKKKKKKNKENIKKKKKQ